MISKLKDKKQRHNYTDIAKNDSRICIKTRNKRRDRAAVEKKEETKEKETEERVRKKECLMFVCLDAAV